MDKLHLETEIAKMGYDTTNADVSKYIDETLTDAKPWQSNATILANCIDMLQFNGVETATDTKLNCLLECAKFLIGLGYVFTDDDFNLHLTLLSKIRCPRASYAWIKSYALAKNIRHLLSSIRLCSRGIRLQSK